MRKGQKEGRQKPCGRDAAALLSFLPLGAVRGTMGLLFGGPAPPAEVASQRQVDIGTSSKFVLKIRTKFAEFGIRISDGISKIEMKAISQKCNSRLCMKVVNELQW